MRFEFLELVMRLAMKFPQTEDPKAAFQGFLIFTKNNLTREARIAVEDRNIFRMKRLYTPEVMSLFFNYQHELRCIYSLMIGTDFKDATTEEWLWLMKRCGVYDRHLPDDQGIHEKECTLMFSFSQMMMADEIKVRRCRLIMC